MLNQVHLCKALTLSLANIVWVAKELHRPLGFNMPKCSIPSNYTFEWSRQFCFVFFSWCLLLCFLKQRLGKDSLESYKLLDIIWIINILFNFSLLFYMECLLRP